MNEEISPLKCPHCNQPMQLIEGNPVFTYWLCKHCNKEFEYDIWEEKFNAEKDLE